MLTKAIIIPVGKSPVQVYRILRSLQKSGNFGLLILAVSEQTKSSGELIKGLIPSKDLNVEVINYNEIKDTYADQNILSWNIFLGPGHTKMSLEILGQVILLSNHYPYFWAYHKELTKKSNIKPRTEKIICVNDNLTINFINNVEKNIALKLYNIDDTLTSELNGNLVWINEIGKFSYTVKVSQEAIDFSKYKRHKYENQIATEVDKIQKIVGKHSMDIKIIDLPQNIQWSNLEDRLKHQFEFKGSRRLK